MPQIRKPSALFSRSDVSRLLNIPAWLLANFADEQRYWYGLPPSVRGEKGRGKKGLYTIADVYKIALAYRLVLADQDSELISHCLGELFPKKQDPMDIAVQQRARSKVEARCVVIDLSRVTTFYTGLPDGDGSEVPFEWQAEDSSSARRPKVTLCSRKEISQEMTRGALRAFLAIPFDEMLNWVDTRILGREVTFPQDN